MWLLLEQRFRAQHTWNQSLGRGKCGRGLWIWKHISVPYRWPGLLNTPDGFFFRKPEAFIAILCMHRKHTWEEGIKENSLSVLTSNTCCWALKVMLLLFFYFLFLSNHANSHDTWETWLRITALIIRLSWGCPATPKLFISHEPSLLSFLSASMP